MTPEEQKKLFIENTRQQYEDRIESFYSETIFELAQKLDMFEDDVREIFDNAI